MNEKQESRNENDSRKCKELGKGEVKAKVNEHEEMDEGNSDE